MPTTTIPNTTTSFFYSPEAATSSPSSYAGRILAMWETSETQQVMSDIWDYVTTLHGLVWEPTTGEAVVVTLGTAVNNYNLSPQPTAHREDASPEYRTAFEAWYASTKVNELALKISQGRASHQARGVDNELIQANSVRRGSTVTVVRGRKVPLGVTGKVFWIGESQWGIKVGMNLTDRKDERGRNLDVVWIAIGNVEVTGNTEEIAQLEARRAAILAKGEQGGEFHAEALMQVANWREGYKVGSAHPSLLSQ